MTLENAKDWTEIVGVVLAVATLIKGLYEYRKQAAQRRAEHFIQMRDRYDEFLDICTLLEQDGASERARQELCKLPYSRKRDFLGFYEEIALMMQSSLIKAKVAHYMFGYYAIRCWSNAAFWDSPESHLSRDSDYWGLFREFVKKMEEIHKQNTSRPVNFRKYRI